LVLVLKQLLKDWDLNEVYSGGLSSYSLFHLVLSFLSALRNAVASAPVANSSYVTVGNTQFPYFMRGASDEAVQNPHVPQSEPGGTRLEQNRHNLGLLLVKMLDMYG
jgi:DNA polymerase sigma